MFDHLLSPLGYDESLELVKLFFHVGVQHRNIPLRHILLEQHRKVDYTLVDNPHGNFRADPATEVLFAAMSVCHDRNASQRIQFMEDGVLAGQVLFLVAFALRYGLKADEFYPHASSPSLFRVCVFEIGLFLQAFYFLLKIILP